MKHGIKYCIMSRIIAIMLIVLIAFTLIASFALQSIQKTNIEKRGLYDAQRNQLQIENTLDEIYNLSSLFCLNPEIRSFLLTKEYRSPSQKTLAINHLINQLDENILLDQYIHSFCIVDKNGTGYWNQCPYDNYFLSWFYAYAVDEGSLEEYAGFTNSYVFPPTQQHRAETQLLSHISNVCEVRDSKLNTIGQIIINLDLSALMRDVFDQNSLFNQIGILDEKGNILYLSSGNQQEFLKTADSLTLNFEKTKTGYYFVNTTSNSHWKIISFLSDDQVTQTTEFPFLAVMITVIFLTLCLIVIFISPILMNISKQIIKLEHAIDLVAAGDLNVSVELQGTRELNNIAEGFNRMIAKTKQYMKEALENQKEKQKVSFELLLAKINPHFIYNTLNSVIYLARQNRNQDVIKLTSAFIYLLQDSIHLEKNSLFELTETEVKVIEKYITIQKYRYADQFSFRCVFDPELKDTYIPKNILQPLIENAIIHGICPLERPGHIELNMKKEDHSIRILIMDDGAGMEQKKADQLISCTQSGYAPKKSSKMRALGLRNIAEKLQFVYHKNYEFTVTSDPSFGTMIRIVLPVRTKEMTQENKFISNDPSGSSAL